MGRKLPVSCNVPRCPNYRREKSYYCDQHTKRKYAVDDLIQAETKPKTTFYTSSTWRKRRAEHLKVEPLCRECKRENRITAAEMVDHIIPIKQGGETLAEANLQSLCNTCHARKRQSER